MPFFKFIFKKNAICGQESQMQLLRICACVRSKRFNLTGDRNEFVADSF